MGSNFVEMHQIFLELTEYRHFMKKVVYIFAAKILEILGSCSLTSLNK